MGISGSQDNNEKKPVALIVGGGYGKLTRPYVSIYVLFLTQPASNVPKHWTSQVNSSWF